MDERLLIEWHNELNAQCFGGALPLPTFHVGVSVEKRPKWERGEWAEGEYHGNGYGKGMILVDPRAPVPKATLAHEMIHQWQDLLRKPMDHRTVFQAWCQHIERITGLTP